MRALRPAPRAGGLPPAPGTPGAGVSPLNPEGFGCQRLWHVWRS
jgi:hypothetical protein